MLDFIRGTRSVERSYMMLLSHLKNWFLEGWEVDIPEDASRYVPDLFNGDSYCMLQKFIKSGRKQPKHVTFLTATHVDVSISTWELVFLNIAESST